MSVSLVGCGAELLAEAFGERVEVDGLDGGQAAVLAMELASSLRFSDLKPIRGAVTGAPETTTLNIRLQQDGFIAVAFRPIAAQTWAAAARILDASVRTWVNAFLS